MISVTANTLAVINAFRHLDRAQREKIAGSCSARAYSKSQVIIAHREVSSDVFFIISGSVRTSIFAEGGREISYQDLFAGDMFGELSAIDHKPRSTHVVALQECLLLSMTSKRFGEFLAENPMIAQATLRKVVGIVRFLCDRVYEFGALDVNRRIRAELMRLSSSDPEDLNRAAIPSMPTHQELANRLATHREAVSRELSSLEKTGLISKKGGAIEILDVRRLASMIHNHQTDARA